MQATINTEEKKKKDDKYYERISTLVEEYRNQ